MRPFSAPKANIIEEKINTRKNGSFVWRNICGIEQKSTAHEISGIIPNGYQFCNTFLYAHLNTMHRKQQRQTDAEE